MTTQFAKENISIEDYLTWKGCSSNKQCGTRLYYQSPFRLNAESRPSLSVNVEDKRWIDWGLDGSDGLPVKGSIVDMAFRFCGTIEAGLKDLELFYGIKDTYTSLKTSNCQRIPELTQSQSLVVTRDCYVQMHALLAYAKNRRIDRDVLDEYCREVWYKNGPDSKERFSIGIKNVLGGWELSSPGFKCSTSPKAYSFFGRGSNEVLVFEGMFDMLSWCMLAKYMCRYIKHDILCLNSVVNAEKVLQKLLEYDKVHLFLDNDSAGEGATSLICQACGGVKDYRKIYIDYNDINEWWCNYNNINTLINV